MYIGDPPIHRRRSRIEPCIFVCSYNDANLGTTSFSWFFHFSVVRCMWKLHSSYTILNHDNILMVCMLDLHLSIQFSL